MPARLPGYGLDLALPGTRAGRDGPPGRRAVPAGVCPTELAPDDDYDPATLGRDAVALSTVLGGAADAVPIGHDWGAVAAYEVARTAPGTFGRIVTLAVPPTAALLASLRFATLGLAARQLRKSWYTAFHQVPGAAERPLDRLIPKLWRDWSPGWDAREDLPRVFAALPSPAHRRAVLRYYRDFLRPGTVRACCRPPIQPVLYLHGTADGCLDIGLPPIGEPMLAPGIRAVRVEGAGHFLQLEQPRARPRPGVARARRLTTLGSWST